MGTETKTPVEKKEIAKQIKVGFPPAFIEKFVIKEGRNLAEFKRDVMNMYKESLPSSIPRESQQEIYDIISLLGDTSKVVHGMNEIKFFPNAGINGREFAQKLVKLASLIK